MPAPVEPDPIWGAEDDTLRAVAHNVSTRYVAFAVDAALGLVMLPFNLEHLGKPLYGLWVLTVSLTTSFGVLDLGYAGSLVRFVARYRASRDSRRLNQILSTLFVVYSGIGLAVACLALLLAAHLDRIFTIDPANVATARQVLLIVSSFVAVRFCFSVFGGVVVGFQQYRRNNIASIVTSIAVAAVNVAALKAGFGLVGLVAAVTAVRMLSLLWFRANAYRAFPGLRIRPADFSLAHLREVTEFSAYMLVLDLGYKVNYSIDTLVLGAFLGTAAVALWAPAQRLTELLIRLTNQWNEALFPYVVHSDAANRTSQLRATFLQATRLSLAVAIPLAGGIALLAEPLIASWMGPTFSRTAIVLEMLAALVVLRVGNATSSMILKGAGEHRRLTAYVGLTGIANVALSVALVKPYGLVGVALGTVISVSVMAVAATFPRACRRVGITPVRAFREAVWPALWPGAVLVVFIRLAAPVGRTHLVNVAFVLALGTLIYAAVFFGIAIGSAERRRYLTLLRQLLPSTFPSQSAAAFVERLRARL